MANVIGVRFQNAGKLYFFDPGAFWPTPGDFVLVETTRGCELGEVVTGVREIADEQLTAPLKQVIRIATAQDIQHDQDNQRAEKEAYGICQRKIADHKLDMKLVKVEYTFDNSKILFYFTANGRVDFRSLVKDLAGLFKTRIELRQIGVRDEAKMLGGLGPCGRPICCGAFLGDFQPVSIKMAKEQSLSLNPTKISGVCGRLMCCLKYEEDNYEQTRKRMPKVGKEVVTPDGNGVVWDLNVLKETVRVRVQKNDSSEVKDYPLADVQRVGAVPVQPVPAVQPDGTASAEPVQAAAAPAQPAAPVPPMANAPRGRAPMPPRNRGERPPRNDRRDRPRTDVPASTEEKREDARGSIASPVQRENPARRPRDNAAPAARPARAPRPPREEGAKPSAAEQAAGNAAKKTPWQEAVAKAMAAAAKEDSGDEIVKEAPIALEDHQDTWVFKDDSDEDDTI